MEHTVIFISVSMLIPTSEYLLEHAHKAVDLASKIMKNYGMSEYSTSPKGERDYVTEVDIAIERAIKSYLTKVSPTIPFLGEEDGGADPDLQLFWVLDPIDGTVNFMRGSPLCGVSLALVEGGSAKIGVIDFPYFMERYVAVQGQGASLNGKNIRVSQKVEAHEIIAGIGDFGVGPGSQERNEYSLQIMKFLAQNVLRVRMIGSAAAQLAWVAAGRLDISITLSNKPWDMQAGVLLVREAGGVVSDSDGTDHSVTSRHTVATNAVTHDFALKALDQ